MLSDQSKQILANVHPQLESLVTFIDSVVPCRVLCGYRDEEAQNAAVKAGNSKLAWPESKHNCLPALAIDICIDPYNPDDKQQLLYFAGFVMGAAKVLGLKLRAGADWEQNFCPAKNRFPDLFHFELEP